MKMLRHVVMFRWAEDVDDAHVAAVAAELDQLPPQIPEIAVYRHGRDLGITGSGRKVGKSKANHEGLVLQTEEPAVRRYAQPTEPLPEPTFTDNPDPLPE